MRNAIFFLLILISTKVFTQTKPIVFYGENDEEVTKKDFFRNRDYSKNLDLYFESDSLQFGILIKRQKFGKLDKYSFNELKSYLNKLSDIKIDSNENIVINYLSALPSKKDNIKQKSTWNILDNDYIKKLHKIADIKQFWISSPRSDNLLYHHQNKINWLKDEEDVFKEYFFPYEVRYGNYILIKPDGRYYYYLGEHSKYEIWESSEKYF